MQDDMFGPAVSTEAVPGHEALTLLEDNSSEYRPRTVQNARADVTAAFAIDFLSAGERLTHKAAGSRYIDIPYGEDVEQSAERLIAFWSMRQASTLNVAGNGMYTWGQNRITQVDVNQWVYDVLSRASRVVRPSLIRSGGQTGSDMAGLVAALALGVPALGLYPKGFRMRGVNKQEIYSDASTIQKRLNEYATRLTR